MIANDPHLPFSWPSVFSPIHLRLLDGPTDVTGSGFPGVPAVLIGRNRHISWGATTNPVDVTDTYLEQVRPIPGSPSGLATLFQGKLEPIQAVPETFRTNNPGSGKPDDVRVVPPGGGIPAATLIVPRRNNGPVIQLDQSGGVALSVQYTGYSGTRELETFFRWDDATNLREFREGLATFDVGSQNWMYGDTSGNIAYFTSAEVPLREDLQAGAVAGVPPMFVRDGTGGNEWLPAEDPLPGQAIPYEILPPEEMPHTVNPVKGFFVSANNDPAGHTLDNDLLNQTRPGGGIYYLGGERFDQFRAGRITDLLAERFAAGKVSVADMWAVQADVGLVDAEFFVSHLVRALNNAKVSDHPALRALADQPPLAEEVGRLGEWD
ncbi:MAG: penicillin acylase family protein, partial [Pseudonocardiaceae bacterium]